MLNIQKKYITYIAELTKILSDDQIQSETLEPLSSALNTTELLIPVIGGFSAGKSSLLNSYLGRDVLPVGITPETELATELRYGDDEYIEAVGHNENICRFALEEMVNIKDRSSEFAYLRVYITSDRLKALAPIVLVDMPGFDSALTSHNKAIAHYINRGTHYIVLTSVEEGNITRSMQRQLTDIHAYGRSFSFMLSKANLRARSEVDEIGKVISEQAETFFGECGPVVATGLSGGAELEAVLTSINPEVLFQRLFCDSLKNQHFSLIENINVSLVSLNNSASDNEQAIRVMREGLDRIVRKRDQLLQEIMDRYSVLGVNSCIDAVGRELVDSLDELVAAAMSGDRDSFSRIVTDVVRSTLIQMVKAQVSEIGNHVISEFAVEVKDINHVMSNFTDKSDWLADFSDKARVTIEKTELILSSLTKQLSSKEDKENKKKIFQTLATILAVTTDVVAPALEILIIFLPYLLSGFLESKRKENLINTLRSDVIPSIKQELRRELPTLLEVQLKLMINQVGSEFEHAITEKQEAVSRLEQEKGFNLASISSEISRLTQLRERLQELARNILFSHEAI